MESSPPERRGLDLRAVRVRPTWGAQEHRRWDQLVATHHYLSFQGLFGKGLRHVATLGSTWIALVGWQAGALKLTARDRWIGWSQEQKLRRLHLVTQNSRFLILPGFQRAESSLAGARSEPAAAVCRHAGGARIPRAGRGDLCGPGPLCRDLLPGRELALAGPDRRLCAPAGCHAGLAPSRPAEGDSRVRTASQRRRGPAPERRGARLAGPGQNRATGGAPAAQPVRVPGRRAGVPSRTGQALQPVHGARAGGRGAASRLPRRDGLRAVRRPAEPAAAPGRGLLLQPQSAVLHLAVDHDVPQHPREPAAGHAGNGRGEVGPAAERESTESPAE